jgi:hypothetical protein
MPSLPFALIRCRSRLLAALALAACAPSALPTPAHAISEGLSPNERCGLEGVAWEGVARNLPLEPANGTTVAAGTPVTFSGETHLALKFEIASSEALLSAPDIDGGSGSTLGSLQQFTSAKAAATPRTIYWTASFEATLENCKEPISTFTTPVRTLILTPSEAELAAARKRQEEEAAAKKQAEAATGTVTLDDVVIGVQRRDEATIELTCSDVEKCVGTLTLAVKAPPRKGKRRRIKIETIGAGSFSIEAGKAASIHITLNKTARALLKAARGRLGARLTIHRAAPLPIKTHVQNIRLEQAAHPGQTNGPPATR